MRQYDCFDDVPHRTCTNCRHDYPKDRDDCPLCGCAFGQ